MRRNKSLVDGTYDSIKTGSPKSHIAYRLAPRKFVFSFNENVLYMLLSEETLVENHYRPNGALLYA